MPNDPLGLDRIEPTIEPDGCNEQEIAAAIGRSIDSIAQLAAVLPLPDHAIRQFRRTTMDAWTQLMVDCQVCSGFTQPDDAGFDGG
jgi:hypothetical protein